MAKRTIKLAYILSLATIVWGALTTSFFGMNIAPDNPIRKISFVDWLVEKKASYHIAQHDKTYEEWVHKDPQLANVEDPVIFLKNATIRDDNTGSVLFEVALLIGAIHVILSMLRNVRRNRSGIGWVIFIIGAYCYFPVMLHTVSIIHFALGLPPILGAEIGLELIYVGIGLALFFAFIQKKLSGALEIMVVIQIFCDVLSYLRLYALGLAGMKVGSTFNELGANASVVFGTIIILFGHSVNLAMSIMGGVIHGLRLNFLEWYHYSFEGGGKRFKPLELQERRKTS